MFQNRKHPSARVEKALTVFNKAVGELHAAADAHNDIAAEASAQAGALLAAHADAVLASREARRVATKIGELLS